tara:strand:- start:709 stop:1128 length:420 start_codon:yes stop_codon:yes gene_type:complete
MSISGCSNLRQAVGSEKIILDEFAIVEKNKLIMPPKFDLQAELDTTNKSESKAKDEISLLFGVERRINMDFIDDQLAQYFSFDQIKENVREIVDEETYNLQVKSRAGIDMLFGDNRNPKIGPLLDPVKEQERIDKLLAN